MTQSLLLFNDFPVGSQMAIPTGDRGTLLYALAADPNSLVGASTLLAQTKFVAKNGNDATGDGSIAKPFLTIQTAISSVSDAAAAKPYSVLVAPGIHGHLP